MNKQKDAVQEAIEVFDFLMDIGSFQTLPIQEGLRNCITDAKQIIRVALKSSPVDVDGVIEKMQSEIRLLREAITINKIKMDAYKQYIETYGNRQQTAGKKE